MPCLCGRLMQGLCGRLMRYAYALLMHNICAKIECLVASTGGLCSPLCGPYARLMQRSVRETARRQEWKTKTEGDRDREREAEKETDAQATSDGQTQAQRDSVKQSGPPSLMQTAYAHKPKSAFILLPMRSLVFALRCSVLAYAGLCASYVVRGIAYAMLMRRFFWYRFFKVKHSIYIYIHIYIYIYYVI